MDNTNKYLLFELKNHKDNLELCSVGLSKAIENEDYKAAKVFASKAYNFARLIEKVGAVIKGLK